jgi:hypothetical protein
LKSGNLFVTTKNGFLVFASRLQTIAALDQKEKLVDFADFSRAANPRSLGSGRDLAV